MEVYYYSWSKLELNGFTLTIDWAVKSCRFQWRELNLFPSGYMYELAALFTKEAYSMQIFLLEKFVMEYLLKANVKYIMSTDIARLFRNENNTHQRVEKGEIKENKAFLSDTQVHWRRQLLFFNHRILFLLKVVLVNYTKPALRYLKALYKSVRN